jgi:hypothetical protein
MLQTEFIELRREFRSKRGEEETGENYRAETFVIYRLQLECCYSKYIRMIETGGRYNAHFIKKMYSIKAGNIMERNRK